MDDATDTAGISTAEGSRFTAQAPSVEDRLKADTVGLVSLDDFRKRRAEALEATHGDGTVTGERGTPDRW